jgi:hypothetical protein
MEQQSHPERPGAPSPAIVLLKVFGLVFTFACFAALTVISVLHRDRFGLALFLALALLNAIGLIVRLRRIYR